MTWNILRTLNLSSRIKSSFVSTSSRRCLSLSDCSQMPYKPEERLPLTDHQKKLYPQVEQEFTDEGYPILKLAPKNRNIFEARKPYVSRRISRTVIKFREEKMDEKQDWPSIWPTARTSVPSAIPLPLRQSYEDKKPPRGKYCNTEILKIANFLHLTPNAIQRHCSALLKFCTAWPEGLDSDDEVRNYFPVTYVYSDYVHSSPSIRDPRSRKVQLKVRLDDLELDARDKDKLIRLAVDRYDKETGILTITTSTCPARQQNEDYSNYLLTALYFESMKHEKWEDDKPECDWERFFWNKSESKAKAKVYRSITKPDINEEVIESGKGDDAVEAYKQSLEGIYINESEENIEAYKLSVEKLLGLDRKPAAIPQ